MIFLEISDNLNCWRNCLQLQTEKKKEKKKEEKENKEWIANLQILLV